MNNEKHDHKYYVFLATYRSPISADIVRQHKRSIAGDNTVY